MKFKGKVAFITGASRGVGKNIALALAREGCDIVAAAKTEGSDARLPGTIHETASEVEKLGVRGLAVRVDVRDDAQIEQGVATAIDKMGRIDFLINNAGAPHWRPMTESPMKKYDLVNGVNARASYA
jgi:citronellol/citronellal dehydrogenase